MRIHLTARANRELTQSLEYLTNENPAAAQWFIDTLEGAFDNLRQHPELGRPTNKDTVRVLTLSRFPYQIFYKVSGDALNILSIFHTAQRSDGVPPVSWTVTH